MQKELEWLQKHLKLAKKIRNIHEGLGLNTDIDREYEKNIIKTISELKNEIIKKRERKMENETTVWQWGEAIIKNGELVLSPGTTDEHLLSDRLKIFNDKKSLDAVIVLRQKK